MRFLFFLTPLSFLFSLLNVLCINSWTRLLSLFHCSQEDLLVMAVCPAASKVNSPVLTQTEPFSLVTQSCLTLYDPMDCNMPGFPVHHQLPQPTRTHVHHISDAIQPSHPLSSPFPPALNLSQHQGLFQFFALGG